MSKSQSRLTVIHAHCGGFHLKLQRKLPWELILGPILSSDIQTEMIVGEIISRNICVKGRKN